MNAFPRIKRPLAFVALLCAGLAQAAIAASVNPDRAAVAASRWLATFPAPLGQRIGAYARIVPHANAAGAIRYFEVDLAPEGFVIVSAEDAVEPIIAFSSKGTFDPSPASPLAALLLLDTEARTRAAASTGAESDAKWEALAPSGKASARLVSNGLSTVDSPQVDPFVLSTWSQSTTYNGGAEVALYNYYTPPGQPGNPNNYVSGCVATAVAQIMRYYEFPKGGPNTALAYTVTVDGVQTPMTLMGGDGMGGPYDWAAMPLDPEAATLTTGQIQAIGALLHDVGGPSSMAYTAAGSAGYVSGSTFTDTFGYASASYSGGDPTSIRTNMDAGWPVLIAISGPSGGHAVVVDGYGYNSGTVYNHLNLGWGGACTAWYNLPNVGTSFYTFTELVGCVCNINPTVTGVIASGRVSDTSGNPLSGYTVTATWAGGSMKATTNPRGIFALVGLPSSASVTFTHSGGSSVYGPASLTLAGLSNGNVIVDDFQTPAVGISPLPPPSAHSWLGNLSARAYSQPGANQLITGFVTTGSGSKTLIIRGDGPALGAFGITGYLADPQLTISSGSTNLATAISWAPTLDAAFTKAGAFSLTAGSHDAALMETLAAGAYSAGVVSQTTNSGVALAEVYDADSGAPANRLVNISARAFVGSGANVLIGGFVIAGTTPLTVVIRGDGPALAGFGVAGALGSTVLTLSNSSGTIATNAGWSNGTVNGGGAVGVAIQSLTAFFSSSVGAFALTPGSGDSGLVATLPPGAYTAQVSGADGSTGIALVEIYEL